MARCIRIQLPEANHRVSNQEDERTDLSHDDVDREMMRSEIGGKPEILTAGSLCMAFHKRLKSQKRYADNFMLWKQRGQEILRW